MNPRNMQSNSRIIEFEVAQQMQNQQQPEPYILLGSPPNFPHSSTHQILPTSGSINNLDGTSLYRLPQYSHQMHPVTNPELGIPAPSAFYNPYLIPASSTRMFSMDQLPSSSNFAPTASHVGGYGVNSFPPNVFRGSSKRNGSTEGFIGNTQYFNSPPPMNVGHFDPGVAILDPGFPLPEFRGNYIGQSFRPPISPYIDVSNVAGPSSEMGSIGGPVFQESASNSRGSQNLPRYTPMLHPLHEFNPPQAIPHYRPLPVTTSSRHAVNNRMQYAVPQPPGIRVYRSHRRSVTPEGIHRHPNLPHLRLEEGVAILEFSGHYEMSGSTIDHHRDMRLDIDYMSYEELLALSERIGNVKTGLCEDAITAQLKTRVYRSSMASIDLEELPCNDDKNDSCVICQDEYEENDKIGSLDCGHEYHVKCLKKWLPVKNTCPICKSTALNEEEQKKSGQIQ
ncbi:hypothetical protein V2J09_007292 [Rumex salicifolius]